jgi:hypothetical protein
MNQGLNDPVIDEIREVRKRISAQFEHDPVRLVAYYMKLQADYADRLIAAPKTVDPTDHSAA